jgi:hemolysin activation/secretion protein
VSPFSATASLRGLLLVTVTSVSLVFSSTAFSQDVPAPLTPGGARPQFEEMPMPQATPPVLQVPPAIDRPLDVEEGPRVVVDSFDLKLDPALANVSSDAVISSAQAALQSLVDNQPAEGLTIGQLEQGATAVTDIFRAEGFILAWAFLPAQTVDDGIVLINVLPGSLAAVEVEGNERYKTAKLQAPFENLIGQPIRLDQTETSILYVRDYPGVSPTAVLSQGEEPGTSNLTMRVTEDRINGGVSYDNYGSELNGDQRLYGFLDWNNPFGYGDRLSVNVLQTFSPADNTYGGIKYDAPMGYRSILSLYANTNTFEVAATTSGLDQDTAGKTFVAGASVLGKMVRGRFLNASVRAALDVKRTEQELSDSIIGEDKLTNFVFGIESDGVDQQYSPAIGVNQGSLYWTHGFTNFLGSMGSTGSNILNDSDPPSTRRLASGDYVGANYDKLLGSFQRLQRVTTNNSLLIRAAVQWSDDPMVSIEQLVLGGPYNMRAFPTSTTLVDKGGFASAEWIVDFFGLFGATTERWGTTGFLFYDYAGGHVNDPTNSVNQGADLAGWGAGIEAVYTPDFGRFTFRLEAADPTTKRIKSSIVDPELIEEETQVWARIGFNFN